MAPVNNDMANSPAKCHTGSGDFHKTKAKPTEPLSNITSAILSAKRCILSVRQTSHRPVAITNDTAMFTKKMNSKTPPKGIARFINVLHRTYQCCGAITSRL